MSIVDRPMQYQGDDFEGRMNHVRNSLRPGVGQLRPPAAGVAGGGCQFSQPSQGYIGGVGQIGCRPGLSSQPQTSRPVQNGCQFGMTQVPGMNPGGQSGAIAPRPSYGGCQFNPGQGSLGNLPNRPISGLSPAVPERQQVGNLGGCSSCSYSQPSPSVMKKGGKVQEKKVVKMAKGGHVKSAAGRGDGIAQKGHTKGRYL